MISLNQIAINFGGFELFKDISFLINQNDRIGLVGRNGAGKTTLLKIIAKLQSFDYGILSIPNNITFGYLPQEMKFNNTRNLYDETRTAFSEIINIESDINKINQELEVRTDYESDEYSNLIEKLTTLNERYNFLGFGDIDSKIEKTLLGLGFEKSDFTRHTSEFSGGWRMRIEIAKILLKNPDILLLDEPTNHLDIESIQWLENYLKEFNGAILLISHDRAFLDNITNRTIEISLGKIFDYKVPYSKFVELKAERYEQQLAAFNNQQKMIEDTEKFIERFRYKSTKAIQVQSRIKQLDKIDRIEIDEQDKSAMHFRFPPAPHSGTISFEIEELSKKYENNEVLDSIDIIIERGDKIAFVGRNGEGKTTLSRILVGELDYSGIVKIGHNVKIGYFAQNQDVLLNGNKTVFETIDEIAVGEIRTKIRNILGSFLFSGEDIDKKVKVLSGGEKSRLALAKLLLEPVNVLILDEPTNHLDIKSKDILKQALIKFDGTLIIVSHDRDFLNGLVNKLFEFKNKKIKEYLGGIYDFLEKKKISNLAELNKKESPKIVSETTDISENKLTYLEKKEQEKIIRKIKNQISDCEKKIEAKESELQELNNILENPAKYNVTIDDEFYKKYSQAKKDVENLMSDWEILNSDMLNF